MLEPICPVLVLVPLIYSRPGENVFFFFKFYFLTCSLVVFSPNGKQRFPINICSQENTCFAFSIRLHQPILRHPIYAIWSARNCLSPGGGGHTSSLFNHFIKQNIKARTKNSIISKAPHENVKMIIRWWVPGIYQSLSHAKANWLTLLIHLFIYFIYLFHLARCVEPSLVTTLRGCKEPRSKAKPILLLGFGEEDKSDERVSGYNHVTPRNPTPLIKDPSPGQTHRHGQTRSEHPP